MRFHVAGLGSIGTLLSYHLRSTLDSKHVIALLHKTEERRKHAASLDPTLHVIAGGVTQFTSGFRHELSDPYAIPEPELDPPSEEHAPDAGYSFPQYAAPGPSNLAHYATPAHHLSPDLEQNPLSPPAEDQGVVDDGGQNAEPIDSLFVATKAHAVLPLIHQLLPRLRPSSTIVLLHNGMGVYERLSKDLFRNHRNRPHIVLTSNTHGAYAVGPLKIVHASHLNTGALQFGVVPDARGRDFETLKVSRSGDRVLSFDSISPPGDSDAQHYSSLRNTVAVLSSLTGLNTSWEPFSHITLAMKRKLVVNAVINPLTALMNCRNGDIADAPSAHRLARAVCEEASLLFAMEQNSKSIAEGKRFAFPPGHPYNDALKKTVISRLPSVLRPDGLMSEVFRVAKATALNTSSMAQDIRANRQTEIGYLNGYLVELGRKHRLKMPTNALLTGMVQLRQDVPLDVLQDLPPRTTDFRDPDATPAEKLVARAWELVRRRKFKRTKFKWRWQIQAMRLKRRRHAPVFRMDD
jgi:2-dehydropantoate 2-reductase